MRAELQQWIEKMIVGCNPVSDLVILKLRDPADVEPVRDFMATQHPHLACRVLPLQPQATVH